MERGLARGGSGPSRRGHPELGGAVVTDGKPLTGARCGAERPPSCLPPRPTKLAELLPVWRKVIGKAGLIDGIAPTHDAAEAQKQRVTDSASPTLARAGPAQRTPDDDADGA